MPPALCHADCSSDQISHVPQQAFTVSSKFILLLEVGAEDWDGGVSSKAANRKVRLHEEERARRLRHGMCPPHETLYK